MPQQKPERILRVGQASRIAGVLKETVRSWIHSGALPATRTPGGHFRIKESDLRDLLEWRRRIGD